MGAGQGVVNKKRNYFLLTKKGTHDPIKFKGGKSINKELLHKKGRWSYKERIES